MNETTEITGNNENVETVDELETIKTEYFGPDELEKASTARDTAIEAASAIPGCKVIENFNIEEGLPEGYGLGIRAVGKRGKPPVAVAITAIPDLATIAEHEKGASFIQDVVIGNLMDKVASIVRPRGDDPVLVTGDSLPFSIDDFISPAKRGEGLATYRAIAGEFVKALKKRGIPFLSAPLLRQLLESAAFAESQFPTIGQEKWETVLDLMISKAKSDGLDVAILEHWKETRDTVEINSGDLNLDGLDGLM